MNSHLGMFVLCEGVDVHLDGDGVKILFGASDNTHAKKSKENQSDSESGENSRRINRTPVTHIFDNRCKTEKDIEL